MAHAPTTLRPSWRVMRLDDNGNRFEVAMTTSQRDAEAIAADFEARGHKQTYWAEPIRR